MTSESCFQEECGRVKLNQYRGDYGCKKIIQPQCKLVGLIEWYEYQGKPQVQGLRRIGAFDSEDHGGK